MNDLVLSLGLEGWKPLLTALLLPPVPFVAIVLAGAVLLWSRRASGWLLVVPGLAAVWLACTPVAGIAITRAVLETPPALDDRAVAALRRAPRTAIVVLGAGRRPHAAEYGTAMLKPAGIERLRYAIRLSRETALPVAFSGGLAPAASPGATEAAIAADVAARDFGRPLRWTEDASRDTRENALRTVDLLRGAGIERIVLVTHGYHMRRSLRNFERALARPGRPIAVVPAPMGLAGGGGRIGAADWLPSREGFEATRLALHEALGLLSGA